MSNYAFIFARGGSKGLPGKNIKKLNGIPLIAYSINVAMSIESIKEVFVSTDDSEIASVAKEYGATVIRRPENLATDNSPEWLSWRHAIEWVRCNRGSISQFISLPATSPLRNKQDVNAALVRLRDTGADICIGITPANRSPYFNMVTEKNNSELHLVITPEGEVSRRQDAPAVYDITTVVYAANPEFIMSHNSLFSGKVVGVEIPKERAVDIDDIYDFLLAEVIISKKEV